MPLPIYNIGALDNVPRAASGSLVYVYNQPTTGITAPSWDGTQFIPGVWSSTATPLATIYADNGGVTPLPNPFPLDGNGDGWFYAAQGSYTVVIAGGVLSAPIILIDQQLLTSSGSGATYQTNGVNNATQTLLNLVQGSNITLANSGGNVTITGTAAAITFKTNFSNNSSQTILDLIAGSGISLSDGGSGQITISATAGATFEVNGTPTSSQSVINFVSGSNVTVTNPSAGNINIDAAYPIFQANGTPLTSSSTVNYQQGSGIVITNPSAGTVNFAVSSAIQPVVQQVQVTLSSSQLLNLHTTPVSLLTAQGTNSLIVVDSVVLEFLPGGTPYATVSTADLAVYVDTTKASNFIGDSTGLLDQTAKTFELINATTEKFFTTDTHSDNTGCFIANVSGSNYTAGNGTAVVTLNYYVVVVT